MHKSIVIIIICHNPQSVLWLAKVLIHGQLPDSPMMSSTVSSLTRQCSHPQSALWLTRTVCIHSVSLRCILGTVLRTYIIFRIWCLLTLNTGIAVWSAGILRKSYCSSIWNINTCLISRTFKMNTMENLKFYK